MLLETSERDQKAETFSFDQKDSTKGAPAHHEQKMQKAQKQIESRLSPQLWGFELLGSHLKAVCVSLFFPPWGNIKRDPANP